MSSQSLCGINLNWNYLLSSGILKNNEQLKCNLNNCEMLTNEQLFRIKMVVVRVIRGSRKPKE
jgi:hypothetical protein